jgi:mevalonate kinase
MDENHTHLVTLGVSHPVLEQIKEITARPEYGLHTKLTGAGGGGCAVTLIPDGTPTNLTLNSILPNRNSLFRR